MSDNNVFGEPIIACSTEPITGFFRDGCCNTNDEDAGEHTCCIVATEEFLEFSKNAGNDLSTPIPQYHFQGVKPGDRWCLCALRWVEAYKNDAAPKIVLEATNEKMLKHVPMDVLLKFAHYEKKTAD